MSILVMKQYLVVKFTKCTNFAFKIHNTLNNILYQTPMLLLQQKRLIL